MRILFNSSILRAQKTGIGTYISELSAALQRNASAELIFFDGHNSNSRINHSIATTQNNFSKLLRQIPGAYPIRRLMTQRHFSRAVTRDKPDIYHDPSLWPLQFDGPTVMTVHDLAHIDFAWTQPKLRVREIQRELPKALQRVSRVLVDSQFIANELQKHYAIAPEKIAVAPLAAADYFSPRRETQVSATLKRYNLGYRHYFLFVGTLEPRKNLSLALRAHAQLPNHLRQQYPLVVAGGEGWNSQLVERELQKACSSGHALKLGYLDQEEMADILAGAKIFVYPSLYEGFGIPLLEAMASGIPVISSNAASLPEVGGAAVRYIHPSDEGALATTLRELIDDESACDRLIEAGLERAKLFTWERCADMTFATYNATIKS